jgi:protein-disulfide isomerase
MNEKLSLPISIVLAGLLIGGGVYLNAKVTRDRADSRDARTVGKLDKSNPPADNLGQILRPIDSNDHILGSPNARFVIVEYSDTECPFCKVFHGTMRALIDDYIKTEKIAWVYRHLPIEDLHPKAFKEAVALECAGSQGGNTKFWEYTNKIYEITPSNNSLDEKLLSTTARNLGLDVKRFDACLVSGEFDPRVTADIKNAHELGVDGTPTSIILDTKTGETYKIEGAYPYQQLKDVVELLMQG